jgi:hypothetical protein
MKTIIILVVLLTTGCEGTNVGEAVVLFQEACKSPLSSDLTVSRWDRKLSFHCAEIKI